MSTDASVDGWPAVPERGWPGRACLPLSVLIVVFATISGIACGAGGGSPAPSDAGVRGPELGPDGSSEAPDDVARGDAAPASLPYATGVVEFSAGEGGGYGSDELPEVVLGPPQGAGGTSGGTRVVSLGEGGEIVVEFGDRAIVDGEGADFIVFENPFYTDASEGGVYQELGEVAVSADGETWKSFECESDPEEPGRWPGCAGWRPVLDYDAEQRVPLDPAITGGDPFDLADVGLDEARYVRIRGISDEGWPPKVGFDLDAVGIVHARRE